MSKLFIYDRDETVFTHRGLGTLPDAVEAEVLEELNGVYDLRVLYPKDGAGVDLIIEERIIKASTPKGEQLFRISGIRKDMGYLEIHAPHVFYDLLQNFIEDTFIQNKGGQGALDQLLEKCVVPHNFTAVSDVPGTLSSRLVRKNALEALMGDDDNSLMNRGGGELERDNHVIRWMQRLGTDRGVVIKHRKNLLGMEFTTDYTEVVTRIMPQGFDGLFLPEKYIISPLDEAYHSPKIRKLEYGGVKSLAINPEDEDAIPHEEALAELRRLAQGEFSAGLDKPRITCFVDFVDLSQTEEYKSYEVLERIYLGDDVTVVYSDQKIDVKARMTSYTWDVLRDRYRTIRVGNETTILMNSLGAGESAAKKVEIVEASAMEKAREVVNNLINSGFGGHVRSHPDRILIMDTEDEATARKVWQWNMAGLAYSGTGVNGPYSTAITMDGKLLGEFLAVNSVTANKLAADVGQSLDLSSNIAITSRVTKTEIMTDPEIQEALKGEDGGSPYTVQIISENGLLFKNGVVSTILRAKIYHGDKEITDSIDDNRFQWTRFSADAAADTIWNSKNASGRKFIVITTEDVYLKATFICELKEA